MDQHSMGPDKKSSLFFSEIKKDHKLPRMFYLINISYVLAELRMNE